MLKLFARAFGTKFPDKIDILSVKVNIINPRRVIISKVR